MSQAAGPAHAAPSTALMVALRVLIATGLVITAVIHWQLAPGYQQAASSGVGQDTLFRIQAVASVLAAVYVLVRGTRPAYLVAAVVGFAALAAVVVTAYVQVPAIGPLPAMYEPVWFTTKTLSAVAEGLAGILAVVGYMLLSRARHRTARQPART